MRARNLLRRYLNTDRVELIDEKVHSATGRVALKLIFVDGKTLRETSEIIDMPYSTLTDKYYNQWLPELFYDFGDD